jgi:hypothetical protein
MFARGGPSLQANATCKYLNPEYMLVQEDGLVDEVGWRLGERPIG